MYFSGQQRKQLRDSLIDAFPTTVSLERMLSDELDKNLRSIAGEGSLQDIVYRLIEAANSQGWVEDLVRAACRDNPGSLKLKGIAKELLSIPLPDVPLQQSQSNQSLKILILAAIPHGLRLDKDIREIESAIRRATNRDLFEIGIRTAVRSQDIRRAIAEERPQIVHFCGHGLEDGNLLLEDDGEKDKPIAPQALASLFELHVDYVKCVLLNACYSEKSAVAISQYINYVIGMNNAIQDKAAIAFAQGFYDGLGYKNLGNQDLFQRAFDEAIVAIKLENISQGEIPVIKKKVNINVYADDYYNRGNARRDLGDNKGAIENYNLAISFNPDLSDAFVKRGYARSNTGDKGGAIDDYKQAIKLNPNDFCIYNSFICDELDDKKSALEQCTQAIKFNPHFAENYLHRGNIRWNLGEKQGAIEDYNQAIKLNYNYARAYYNRGLSRDELGDTEGAIRDFSQTIKINPNFIYSYINRGDILNRLGDKKGAIEDYTQAIKLNSNYAIAYYSRAFPRSSLGDQQGAIEDCSQAIKLDPNYAEAYYMRAAIRLDMSDNSAIEDCNQVIKLDPNYAIAYHMRGDIRNKLGDTNGAIEDYTQVIKLDPNYADAYYMRGATRNKLGDTNGAIEDHTQVIKLDPNYADAYYRRAFPRSSLGDTKGAIEDCTQTIKLNPNHTDAYCFRGLNRSRLGDTKGAIEDYTQTIKLNPNHADAYYFRGLNRDSLGDKKIAIEDFQNSANIYRNLGKIEDYNLAQGKIKKLQQKKGLFS